jgi:hypothetical protein
MAHKIVRIEMVEVGSGHGVKALIRDSRTGRKIAETDVRPFGFDAAVHSDALAEIEGRGWSWDGRGVVKDWEGNHSRPRSARRARRTTTILYQTSNDWGCEYTDADLASYEQAVADAIVALYPDAEADVQCIGIDRSRVIVTTRDADGRILCDTATAVAEEEMELAVKEIAHRVWEAADFWA